VAPRARPEDCERMCIKRVELETEMLGDSTTSFEECVRLCKSASA
jgi:hypothetical protein